MNEHATETARPGASRQAALALVLLAAGCGGAVTSGVAVGKVGHRLSAHAQAVPQGAEVCALQDALTAPAGGGQAPTEKGLSTTCSKALKSDQLWRRVMIVLSAYGESLESMSAGGKSAESAGQLEAASTGASGNWIEVDDATEKAARDAATQLVNHMATNPGKGDLGKNVQGAAPHVKTLCDGLTGYLEAQTKSLGDIQKEAEKKRTSRTDRRCGALDTRTVCVSESAIDRVVFASVFGQLAALESNHAEARNAVAGFCAAHRKLEDAAAGGRLSKDATYGEIVDAVKASRR